MKTLYTFQGPNIDLTQSHNPPRDYIDPTGAFYDMVRYLGWNSWVWCLEDLGDYDNEWFTMGNLTGGALLTLRVPREKIKWCGLNAQCENSLPVPEWFYADPQKARQAGDIPQGLIKAPIKREWVLSKFPAGVVLRELGLS